jgi:hypothetical protein
LLPRRSVNAILKNSQFLRIASKNIGNLGFLRIKKVTLTAFLKI